MTDFPHNWPTAYPKLSVSAQFRTQQDDFFVSEITNRQLHASGPHLYLHIEKRGVNTHWLARQLANHAKIDLKDVGYAGLKDRHAVTRQWFSLPLKNNEPDLTHLFAKDEFTLLSKGYYGVKLKRGALGGNAFRIVLRNVQGDQAKINQRLELIRNQGVPNYFGEQRFGHDFENIQQAQQLFESGKRPRNRQKASMYTSAARSYLFNNMLAKRIELKQWDIPMEGEVFGFAGSLRGFKQENNEDERNRLRAQRIHPSCALWGKGDALSEGALAQLEQTQAHAYPLLSQGLEKQGLKQERRATRMLLPDLFWQWQDDSTLVLRFNLASGYFATSVLRELGEINVLERDQQEASRD
ncbi:tRNA pseudouridine(13) synthase TruD [Oceaniserpentilla sp. 4NH20-0058]|uniref:tRNA pseudouridine(13) synthase TruD n=1 Tax=Oceaniserpentilla sp. 4NH20-0058 TaxID=3127660 RepID=UPI003104603F